MEAAAPDVVAGRYRIGAVLGHGGMSEVRAAVDLRLDRAVAVKLLRRDMAEQPQLRRRFAAEARAAARVSHPHVVPIYDVGEHDGIPFIVMECLDGRTLADEFAAGPIDQERACVLARQILSALDAAHREGVVHRDIKPGNVLLTPAGDAKVADFGIAKIAESHDATTTGVLLGTPAYLAPERVAGEPATAESDIYAVGVLLFEALTATKPFTGETALAVLNAILRAEPPRLSTLRSDLDPALVAVVERAMAKNTRDRFQSAAEMMGALGVAPTSPATTSLDATLPIDTDETELALRPPTDTTESMTVTRALPADPRPAAVPARTTPPVRRPRRRLWSVIALLATIVVGLLIVFLVVRDDGTPARGPTVPAPTDGAIPADLERAIAELEQAVRP